MARLCLGLSYLREHKFKHSYQDSFDPLCNSSYNVKITVHFFLHYSLFANESSTLFRTLQNLDNKLIEKTDSLLINILIFGKESLNK